MDMLGSTLELFTNSTDVKMKSRYRARRGVRRKRGPSATGTQDVSFTLEKRNYSSIYVVGAIDGAI
jgi:hypothetical protein